MKDISRLYLIPILPINSTWIVHGFFNIDCRNHGQRMDKPWTKYEDGTK
ncbi:MAG: hypothetical protein N4A32_06000 [Marinifilaceae bacterium]|nr:hypothetical protein [Marinifilaceae bacterium]